MQSTDQQFGRLIAIYGASAPGLQRAFFLFVLSAVFSLANGVAYLVSQRPLFVLLALGFTVVSAFSLLSFISLRSAAVRVFEGGVEYRKFRCLWNEIENIERVSADKRPRLEIKTGERRVLLPAAIDNLDSLEAIIKKRLASMRSI